MKVRNIDSSSTSARMVRPLKPSVFSTPISLVRSLTDCAMVLAVTSSMVKNTAAVTETRIAPMLPTCSSSRLTNCRSVAVLVSLGEFSNCASMRAAMASAWLGSSTRTAIMPAWSLPNCSDSLK